MLPPPSELPKDSTNARYLVRHIGKTLRKSGVKGQATQSLNIQTGGDWFVALAKDGTELKRTVQEANRMILSSGWKITDYCLQRNPRTYNGYRVSNQRLVVDMEYCSPCSC